MYTQVAARRREYVAGENKVCHEYFQHMETGEYIEVISPRWRLTEVRSEMRKLGYDWGDCDEYCPPEISKVIDIEKLDPKRERVEADYTFDKNGYTGTDIPF